MYVMSTILFNIPLYFQAMLLDTPTRSGTRLIAPFFFTMVAAFVTGNLITYARRLLPTTVFGYAFIVLRSISLASMTRTFPTWTYSKQAEDDERFRHTVELVRASKNGIVKDIKQTFVAALTLTLDLLIQSLN
jgi:hypothetical protein